MSDERNPQGRDLPAEWTNYFYVQADHERLRIAFGESVANQIPTIHGCNAMSLENAEQLAKLLTDVVADCRKRRQSNIIVPKDKH